MPLIERNSPRQMAAGLLVLRVVVGAVFLAHGWLKISSFGIAGVTGFFQSLGIPMPGVMAVVVTAVELLGGLALILGVLTRLTGLALAADMVGAIGFAKLHGGFFAPDGFEFELTLMAAALALALTGAGAFSVDDRIGKR